MTFLLSLVIFFPKLIAGFALANLLWKDRSLPAVALKFAIGIPLGLALSSSLFFLTTFAGISPRRYSQVEFWGVLTLLLVLILRSILILKKRWLLPTFSWQTLLPAAALLPGLALSIGGFLFYASMHPHGFEDAWSIWNFTPRFLYRSGSLDVLLNSELYQRFHPDYPLELGLNIAWGWFVLGRETTRVPMAIAFLATFTPVLILWIVLHHWKGAWTAVLGGYVLLTTLHFPSAVGQYADALLTLHMLATAVLLYLSFHIPQPGLFVLTGLLAGSSAWVKNEGLLFVFVLLFVCILASWNKHIKWENIKWLVVGIVLPLVVVLVYKIVVDVQSDLFTPTGSIAARLLDLSRWRVIGWNMIVHSIDFGNWPVSIFFILLMYAVLVGHSPKDAPRQHWLFLLWVGQLAGYFGIYLITPHDLQLHINTSIDRLLSHIFPLFTFWIFLSLRSPDAGLFPAEIRDMKHEPDPSHHSKNAERMVE